MAWVVHSSIRGQRNANDASLADGRATGTPRIVNARHLPQPQRRGVRAIFGAIVDRRQVYVAMDAAEGSADDVVGEGGVLRQQRAVDIGADGVAVDRALGAVFTVVTEAVEDARERECTRPRRVRPPWFSKPTIAGAQEMSDSAWGSQSATMSPMRRRALAGGGRCAGRRRRRGQLGPDASR